MRRGREVMRRFRRQVPLALLVAATVGMPAFADLYRCTGPNGNLVFTDDASTCPGASKHEPAAAVQTHTARPAAANEVRPPAKHRTSTADPDAHAAMKRHWQEKKRAKLAELRALEERTEYLSRYVTGCNRGADIITQDEFGIERTVPCDEIRADYHKALASQGPLREYLENGLARECRKAGCLPGWIR